jgi:uncharacterized repeat protein (TIGR01451 family)
MQNTKRRWLRLSTLLALFGIALLVPASAHAATADLAIGKSDSPDPVTEGAVLTYTITVSNTGPGTATGATLTDELASHVEFISATPSQGSCDIAGKTVTCELGALSAGSGATATIEVRPKKTGELMNSASVALSEGDTDPVMANNSATETTTVVAEDGGGGGGGGGATCAGRAATIVGTSAADTITGTTGRDVIKARGGNDQLRGLAGNDVVCAGGGKDTVRGGSGGDRLKGGSGKDVLKGGGGNDALRGGPGRDKCRGGSGNDTKRSC